MNERNHDDFIFDPPLISTKTVESVKRAQQNPASLSLGLPALSEFIMAQKSKVIGVLGDTSQGKTSLMRKIASEMSKQIDQNNNEIGLYITWEDNIEDFGLVDFAEISLVPIASMYNGTITEAEFNRMLKASTVRAASPLWLAGHSETSGIRPMLTMTDIWAICENLTVKQGRKIRFIMFDYIQRINREDMRKEGETRMQYSAVMDSIKNIALSFQSCVFVGSQVRRDQVEKGKWRQPQAHWAMETSNFEHSCDGMLSVWMPSKSKDVWKLGDCLQEKKGVDGTAIFVTKELMLIEILKQKKAAAQILKAVDFIPEYGMFVEYGKADETRYNIKKEYQNA